MINNTMKKDFYRNRKSLMIAIDFDGTIVDHAYPEIGALRDNARDVINELYDRGHRIIIWTARMSKYLTDVSEFLALNDIKYHKINKNLDDSPFKTWPKIAYDIIIDDRNIGGIPPWNDILELILEIERG